VNEVLLHIKNQYVIIVLF